MLLSQQELIELTGRKRPSKVAEQLSIMGIRFIRGADSWPRVHLAEIDRVLVGAVPRGNDAQPDMDGLRCWQDSSHGSQKNNQ